MPERSEASQGGGWVASFVMLERSEASQGGAGLLHPFLFQSRPPPDSSPFSSIWCIQTPPE
ncbi:MAG: hypothetical protein JW967_09020 [Dehalococcoidales bacterium]|nr:hypothetical protein [Dehalococcoidales bacterium]